MKFVLFKSTWCAACKQIDTNFPGVDFKGMDVFIFDVDRSVNMCKRYNIRTTPVLLITDKHGNEISRELPSFIFNKKNVQAFIDETIEKQKEKEEKENE